MRTPTPSPHALPHATFRAARPHAAAGVLAVLVLGAAAALTVSPARAEGGAAELSARHAELRDELARSPFGRPLLLEFTGDDAAPTGRVHAVLNHPMEHVARTLSQPQAWCDILRLQTNVKGCRVQGEGSATRLEVGLTRRMTDDVSAAQWISLRFEAPQPGPQGMVAQMRAEEGPLGTRDYRLRFQAVPLRAGQVFVSLSYAYRTGAAARWATQAYLSSSGRDKVGFTVAGRDEQGRPVYVGGIQGVAERNTMRYFLAIESVLDTWGEPTPQRLERRWRQYHSALQRHPQQLRETTLDDYLAMKRREAQAS